MARSPGRVGAGNLHLRLRRRLCPCVFAVNRSERLLWIASRNSTWDITALASGWPYRCSAQMSLYRLRVASDDDRTFTDTIAYDEAAKRVSVAKVPTTPENRALGTVRGLLRALELQGRRGDEVDYVGHGMTTATNAVIQRRGGHTAFITNEGFRDLLLIGRQARPSLYDIRQTRPEPLVAREDCHTVRGRLDPWGHEVTPLDEEGLRAIAARLKADRIEAVAICFLHSYANPAHERRAKAILTQALPGVPVCA